MTVVLHHLEASRSHRILWLLAELGVEPEIVRYQRHPRTFRAPASLREVHPLGRAPIVEIDGTVHAESGAIVEALLDRFDAAGTLRPAPGTDAHRAYRFWLHFAEGSMMPPLLFKLIMSQLKGRAVPWFARPITRAIATRVDAAYADGETASHLRFLETTLAGQPFLAGDAFTAADVQMAYPIEAALTRSQASAGHPRVVDWLTRMQARPAYQRAVALGGPPLTAPG